MQVLLALLSSSWEAPMASLTIRKRDDAIRDELRLRAARNGRSVEDEVRVILRDASQHSPSFAAPVAHAAAQGPAMQQPRSHRDAATGLPRRHLIIAGGAR